MKPFKRARMYGARFSFLLTLVLTGFAQSELTASQDSRAQVCQAQTEPALAANEGRVSIAQKVEPQPDDPWTNEQLIYPEELLQRMSRAQEPPLLLHIGVAFLFKSGHIPRSTYVGQASKAEGIENLKKAVQEVPRNREIVLYCGCCPWKDCPNIRPAFKAVRELRFTNVKLLYLPNSFAQDWVEKGLRVEKGQSTGRANLPSISLHLW